MMDIRCVIFDLGGVLIELSGPPVSTSNSGMSEDEIWRHWLRSSAVRDYESGKCDHHEFGTRLKREFRLEITIDQLIEDFIQWPVGFYPESENIVQQLTGSTQLACLSNTNELHWQRFSGESDIYKSLDHVFLSHQMGLLKPDQEIYQTVQKQLGLLPDQLLFLDDNQINVDAASARGWQAVRTRGPAEVIN